jgi:hypothetical protein
VEAVGIAIPLLLGDSGDPPLVLFEGVERGCGRHQENSALGDLAKGLNRFDFL